MPPSAGILSVLIEKYSVPLDENGFVDWIVDAQSEDCIAYYRGHLGRDRFESTGTLYPGDCRKLVAVARRVMVAAEQGLVFPLQKRLGEHDFVYLAVRATGRLNTPSQNTPFAPLNVPRPSFNAAPLRAAA
jgi:hypothetical protein